MAYSKCAHCDSTQFEIREVSAAGANFKYNFIQCARCGNPVGVVDYSNLEQTIIETHKLVKRIAQQMGLA